MTENNELRFIPEMTAGCTRAQSEIKMANIEKLPVAFYTKQHCPVPVFSSSSAASSSESIRTDWTANTSEPHSTNSLL